ncbi:hypothetical protein BVRB_2g027910 [Beta vulgaris subsp. vulgaris]|nr:hypothetical protein BVRB_2g027910 [Beta vulgaris subsp. vulgaris]
MNKKKSSNLLTSFSFSILLLISLLFSFHNNIATADCIMKTNMKRPYCDATIYGNCLCNRGVSSRCQALNKCAHVPGGVPEDT